MDLSTDDIREIYDQLKVDYGILRDKQRTWQELVDRDYKNKLEDGAYDHIIKPDTAQAIVELPANFLGMDTIIIKQEPKKASDNKKSSGIETALQGLTNQWIDTPPYFRRTTILDLAKRGEAYYRITVAPEIANRTENFTGIPFLLDSIDPFYVMSSSETDQYGRPEILFYTRILPLYTIRRLVEKNNSKDYPGWDSYFKIKDKLGYVEWWTPEKRGYMAGPEIERLSSDDSHWQILRYNDEEKFPNPYKFVPWVRGYLGRDRPSEGGNPYNASKSLLDGCEDLIIQESRNETRMDTMAAYAAFIEEDVKVVGDYDLAELQTKRKPGIPRVSTDTVTWTVRAAPGIPVALLQHADKISARLNQKTPAIARGEPLPGEPAVSASNRFNWTTQAWEPLKIGSNHMLSNALVVVLQTIENMDLSVEISGETLNKEEIGGYYGIRVKVVSGNPEDKRWKTEQGKGLWGFMPPVKIVENYFEEENSSEFLTELYAWKLIDLIFTNLNNPLVQPIAELLAEAFQLKLEQKGLIPPRPQTPQTPIQPNGNGNGAQPAINGSPRKGIAGVAAQGGTREMDNLQMLQQVMKRRLQ